VPSICEELESRPTPGTGEMAVRQVRRNGKRRTYFRRIPKNMRNFEVSSGGFSAAVVVVGISDSDAVEGAVEAGDSWKDPDEAEAMVDYSCGNALQRSEGLSASAPGGCPVIYREFVVVLPGIDDVEG
jgi:hypothetical protein